MPAAGSTSKKPTKTGEEVLKIVLQRSGSIAQGARDAGVHMATLRRRIYSTRSFSMGFAVVEKLVAYGIPKRLLLAS